MKILILANHVNSIVLFRMELLETLLGKGHEVVISLPVNSGSIEKLEKLGIKVIDTPVEQRGTNPIRDLKVLWCYWRIIRKENPDKIIAYTVKCNIYGGIASRIFRVDFFPNVTGLGYALQNKGFLKTLVSWMYKMGMSNARMVFVENPGIKDELIEEGIVKLNRCHVLNGAGVNLDKFNEEEYPPKSVYTEFLFVGRIMKEKGIEELMAAINHLFNKGMLFHFSFVGPIDDEYTYWIDDAEKRGFVSYYGYQTDVRPYLKRADCLVLPSWHEGMANVLLEAASMARPLITSDIHGCREAVIPGETGLLFEVHNAEHLETVMLQFMSMNYDQRKQMGVKGREYMQKKFDKRKVVEDTVSVIFGE